MAAEHGFFYRPKGDTSKEWRRLLRQTDSMWIENVKDMMRQYSEKTDGAFIEEKDSMIVWNYKDSD
jgi:trehalose 6-phosphate synthase/phosphatase